MTEATLRTRLRRKGWSGTSYPAVNLLIAAGRMQDATIRPIYRVGGSMVDHTLILERALRALNLAYVKGYDGKTAESAFIRLSPRTLKLLTPSQQ